MAGKILSQFLMLTASFLALWLGLSQIEFFDENEGNPFSKASERKLGEMILESLQKSDREISRQDINAIVDTVARRICDANQVVCDSIRIHVIVNSDVNAFALPDHQMVIYTGLIARTKNAEELAGVIAHEVAHMEKNHVMKKLIRETGIAMLFVLLDGGRHYEILNEVTRMLSSSAFNRSQEREADEYAVTALAKADMDPENLANFLFRFSGKNKIPEELVWLSTHPDSKERAADVIKQKKELSFTSKPVILTPWEKVVDMASKVEGEEHDEDDGH